MRPEGSRFGCVPFSCPLWITFSAYLTPDKPFLTFKPERFSTLECAIVRELPRLRLRLLAHFDTCRGKFWVGEQMILPPKMDLDMVGEDRVTVTVTLCSVSPDDGPSPSPGPKKVADGKKRPAVRFLLASLVNLVYVPGYGKYAWTERKERRRNPVNPGHRSDASFH